MVLVCDNNEDGQLPVLHRRPAHHEALADYEVDEPLRRRVLADGDVAVELHLEPRLPGARAVYSFCRIETLRCVTETDDIRYARNRATRTTGLR